MGGHNPINITDKTQRGVSLWYFVQVVTVFFTGISVVSKPTFQSKQKRPVLQSLSQKERVTNIATEHVDIPDGERHEPKGADTATSGQVYVSDGANSGTWKVPEPKSIIGATAGEIYVADGSNSGDMKSSLYLPRMGVWDYNDLATASTPIALSGTKAAMTNDGLGSFTNTTFALSDLAPMWNTSTNRFDFTPLSLGDTVDVRYDFTVTTTAVNTVINTYLRLAEGHANQYDLLVGQDYYKAAGTYNFTSLTSVYMGDAATKGNPGLIMMTSDAGSATVKVNGWYTRVLSRGLI